MGSVVDSWPPALFPEEPVTPLPDNPSEPAPSFCPAAEPSQSSPKCSPGEKGDDGKVILVMSRKCEKKFMDAINKDESDLRFQGSANSEVLFYINIYFSIPAQTRLAVEARSVSGQAARIRAGRWLAVRAQSSAGQSATSWARYWLVVRSEPRARWPASRAPGKIWKGRQGYGWFWWWWGSRWLLQQRWWLAGRVQIRFWAHEAAGQTRLGWWQGLAEEAEAEDGAEVAQTAAENVDVVHHWQL